MSKVDFLVVSELSASSKEEAIKVLIEELDKNNYLSDKEKFYFDVLERESTFPTYIGHEIGLPHSQSIGVIKPCVTIGRFKSNIVWTEEKENVNLVFLIAVPKESKDNLHLKILSKLARLLMHEDFRDSIKNLEENKLLELLNKSMEEE
ncbi:MAG: fructose PTS transporter subunit IIA [Peptacetobacter hiranonis]|nr:fructose PTS transporter subunit IIA [Peptacetobacter hiranonis]